MKEKGFSLVELIAVLVLLALIIALAMPAILNVFRRSDDRLDDATRTLLIANAKSYFSDKHGQLPNTGIFCVRLNTLVYGNYTIEPINPNASAEANEEMHKGWSVGTRMDGSKRIFELHEGTSYEGVTCDTLD